MSTSSPPAGNSMRQQLDELDALLQRMLSLPINQVDEAASEPPRRPAVDLATTPVPGRRGQMLLLDGSAPVPTPQSAPPAAWDPHWNINLNPQQGSSVLGPRSPAAQRTQSDALPPVWRAETVAFAPARQEPAPQPPLSSSNAAAPIARPEPIRQPTPEPTPLSLWPVVAVNRVFDALMLCFGPPGQWFCTAAGRTLLGYTGMALLATSIALAAGWIGWPR
jgi:hypothetical protein